MQSFTQGPIEGRIEMLRRSSLLAAAPDEMLRQMSAHAIEKHYRYGEYIFWDGEPSDCLYVVVRGQVDVIKASESGEVPLAHLTTGQPLGEMGLLEEQPRSASARAAHDDTVLLELEKEHVIESLQSRPQVLREAVKLYGERLRTSNAELQRKYVQLAEANRRLQESYNDTLLALSHALDLRDQATEGHSQRVTAYSLLMGQVMGLDNDTLESLRLGALLHDIGKIGVSDTILHKKGRLTDEEWEKMRSHPTWGKGIIADIEFLARAVDVVYGHHEKWNGSGYPQGLAGEAIPLGARIFAIADVFDALTMERSYKTPWPPETARDEIVKGAGSHFDLQVVEIFQRVFPQMLEVIQYSKDGQLAAYLEKLVPSVKH
jgi:putative nucleotidyltransferase with HDIG domain